MLGWMVICTHVWVDGWLVEWMDRWMEGWVDGWMVGWVGEWWLEEQTGRQTRGEGGWVLARSILWVHSKHGKLPLCIHHCED